MRLNATYLLLIVPLSLASVEAAIVAPPPLAGYSQKFADAVTGDNEFQATDGERHWFIDPDADNYQEERYERPTAQSYKEFTVDSFLGSDNGGFNVGDLVVATDKNNPAYFGYLDIVNGYFHVNAQDEFMYFAIELFGNKNLGSNFESKSDFGESSLYNIRLSSSPAQPGSADSHGGLLLSADAKDFTSSFTNEKLFGYYDENSDVGGSGVSLTKDDGDFFGNGYETSVISDGKNHDDSSLPGLLYGRKTSSSSGRPVVEFAFDYGNFNEQFPDYAIDPDLSYLLFEATRGLKGSSNYFWNDQYTLAEAGSPYYPEGASPVSHPQNIYELDTLVGLSDVISEMPEPGTFTIWSLMMLMVTAATSRTTKA